MSRKFITVVTAAAIAVAGLTASQAQALDKRTRNVILGATALAILGAAISSAERNDGAYVGTRNHPRPRPHGGHHNGHGHGHNNGHGHGHAQDQDHPRGPQPGVHPRPVPGRVIFSELPERCAYTINNGNGAHRVFETRCLQRNYRYANRLPKSCRRTIRIGGRNIDGYGGGCLRQHSRQTSWINRR